MSQESFPERRCTNPAAIKYEKEQSFNRMSRNAALAAGSMVLTVANPVFALSSLYFWKKSVDGMNEHLQLEKQYPGI